MAIEVELPGGEIAEFPDDMPQEQIHAAVKKHLAPAVTADQAEGLGIVPRSGLTPDIARKEAQDISNQQILNQGGTVLKSQEQLDAERAQRWSAGLGEAAQSLNIAPKITVPLAKGVGAGAAGLVAPENLLWMAAPGAAGKVMGQAFKATMAGQTAATAFEAGQDLAKGDTQEGLKKLGEAAATGGVLAIPHGTERVPETLKPRGFTTPEVLEPLAEKARAINPKQAVIDIASQVLPEAGKAASDVLVEEPEAIVPVKGGESNASSQQKAAEVHGDVREQPVESEGTVPVEESGKGVQPPPQAEGALALTADVKSIEDMDQKTFADEMTKRGSLTPAAYDLGLSVTDPAHLEALQQAAERVKAKGKAAMAKGDFNVAAPELMKGQFFREAYEAATGTGSAGKALREKDPNYQPPFPEGKPKEVISDGSEKTKEEKGNERLLEQTAGVEQASAVPETPAKVEAKVDQAVKKGASPENISELVGGAGKAVVSGLYDSMFERMKAGKLPEPFSKEKQSSFGKQAKALFDQGKVKSADDLQQLANPQPLGAGPGAATRPGAVLPTDIGEMETNIPPLEKLADAVKSFPQQAGAGFKEKLKQWMDEVGLPVKDKFSRALTEVKARAAAAVNEIRKEPGIKAKASKAWELASPLPKVTTMDRAVGKWNLEDTEGDLAARRFSNAVKERFPDRSKLRALSNWINAGGDRDLLQRQADLTKDPQLKKTYEDALKFGPAEEKLAREVRQYHDEMLSTAMQAGALEEGLENYIHRYYPRENDPTRKKLESAINTYRFTKNFAGFKRRFYDSDFEAEQAGLKPEKDAAKRILAYDQGFRKALTARAFVKDRYAAKMEDGRPEIDVVGTGVPSTGDLAAGEKGAYLIKPKSKAGGDSPEDYRGDYISFDHPAFRKWKWVGQDAQGKPILMEGEMAAHPDAVKKYKALFERSWFQKNPIGRALLMPSNFVKQTMLALSAFHPVQIGIHAIEHKVNPFKLTDLNTRDPAQAKLIEGGLVVSDLGGAQDFSEGVSGSGLFGKIPIVGEQIKASQDWLFKDFIPRIKMTMALDALERNRKTYAKDLASGKITDEQLVRLTARESNAAFGEQNYRAMFRHKGFQDLLRFAFLAPDFGEARLRFPAQALTKYGGEQRMALVLGAIGMATVAKSLEYGLTGQVNWNRPFTVTYKDREYGLRNVASDLYHMITDPAGYLRNRLNPIYTRAALEMLSGRDAFGRKRTGGQQVLDEAKQIVPISGRGLVEKDQKFWESFINAIGLTEHRKSAFSDEMKDINKWKEKKGYTTPGEFVYDADKDPYSHLTSTLTYGSVKDARKELDKLVDGKTPAEARKVADHYRRSLKEHQFLTGSRAHEAEYVKGLDTAGKERYAEAKKERQAMWQKFVSAYRSKFPVKQQ